MHPIDLTVVLTYIVVIAYIGLRVSQKVKTAQDFFLAGRTLTWWVIGLSIIGTNVDTNGYIGASGNAYSIGIAQANFEWIGAIPAMIIASLIFIPLYWRAGVYSIAEYLGLRYNQAVRLVAAVIGSTVSVFAMGVAMWALAITLETFIGWPIWVGILTSGTVVGLYSIAGGLGAVALTDSIQVCIMFVCGLIIAAIGISDAGGAASFISKLTAENPTHLNTYLPADHGTYPWHGVILGLGLVLSPAYWVGGQAILQRTLGAKSQWDASAGMMFAALAKTLVPVLIVFPGLLALVMMANIEYPDKALPWVIKNVLPVGVSGLMFVAIIAALQSSIDSSLNSTALIITRDIRHVLIKNHNPASDLKIGRFLTLALLLAAMFVAPYIGDLGGIFNFLQSLLSLFQGPMLALLLLGALTKRATATAGIYTLVSGVALAGILSFAMDLNLLYVAFFSFCYALPALWIISGFTQPHSDEYLRNLTYSPWRAR